MNVFRLIIGYKPWQFRSRTIAIMLPDQLNVRLVKRLFAIAPGLWNQGSLGSSNPQRLQNRTRIIASATEARLS